jgi:hypothetical protein
MVCVSINLHYVLYYAPQYSLTIFEYYRTCNYRMDLTTVIFTLFFLLIVFYVPPFIHNYYNARVSGFPYIICPVDPGNPVWMVFANALRASLARVLPVFIFKRIRYALHGWEVIDLLLNNGVKSGDGRLETPGPAFIVVTPGRNELWIEDPELAHIVLTRRKDFGQAVTTKRRCLSHC